MWILEEFGVVAAVVGEEMDIEMNVFDDGDGAFRKKHPDSEAYLEDLECNLSMRQCGPCRVRK